MARKIKTRVTRDYTGKSIIWRFSGKHIITKFGTFYCSFENEDPFSGHITYWVQFDHESSSDTPTTIHGSESPSFPKDYFESMKTVHWFSEEHDLDDDYGCIAIPDCKLARAFYGVEKDLTNN